PQIGLFLSRDTAPTALSPLSLHDALPIFLSVRANRTERGGAGTVRWDDEGVETGHFALVEAGILRDFQTTRESATWLADRYVEADRKSTRLNSSHVKISYAVFCLKKKKNK